VVPAGSEQQWWGAGSRRETQGAKGVAQVRPVCGGVLVQQCGAAWQAWRGMKCARGRPAVCSGSAAVRTRVQVVVVAVWQRVRKMCVVVGRCIT